MKKQRLTRFHIKQSIDAQPKPTDEMVLAISQEAQELGGNEAGALKILAANLAQAWQENSVLWAALRETVPETDSLRGRPRNAPRVGLAIPKPARSAGAPKKNSLPRSMKAHAIDASDFIDRELTSSAHAAAYVEICRNGIEPTPRLVANLQRRISEYRRINKK